MGMLLDAPGHWLPFVFAALMGLSILVYVVLDGFDLGVGILLPAADEAEKDMMIASIGPFWDANETWLVLAVGILLVAFPVAHGVILQALYLPVFVMLVGLIARGVAFEFRAKVIAAEKERWNRLFFVGSLFTALAQGWMLGLYIMGLEVTPFTLVFAGLTAVCLAAGFSFIGATWLVLKTEGELQRKAVAWAKAGLAFVVIGMAVVSLATPLVSPRIFERWFSMPEILLLAPLPLGAAGIIAALWLSLGKLPAEADRWCWLPFALGCGLFVLAFTGLAYSFYPYVVPEALTIYDAAAAPESLAIILVGVIVVMPIIIGATVFAYRVFGGKATSLHYD
jgi:cytochrome bd ubiquinol oxidase subunit II